MGDHALHPCARPGLSERLALEADAATAEIMPQVLTEIPHYRTLDPDQLADVEQNVRAGFLTTLELWAAGRPASPEQLKPFRVNGATRAAEGRPLPVVLRAYRISGLAIYDYVVARSSPPLDVEEERNFARCVMTFVDQLSNEVTIGYVETTGQLATQQGQARRELLEDLLAGRLLAAAELAERAATLRLDLPPRPSLLVAAPSIGDGGSLADRAEILLGELARVGAAAPLRLITRGQLVIIDEAIDTQAARRALGVAGLTGVMLEVGELTDLATAYHDAREIHEFLREGRVRPAPLVDSAEARLLAVLARARRDGRADAAVTAILRDLATPQHAALLETLDAYLLAGNAVSAANMLGIHAQTMRYRLRRLREITGRDPAHGWDRFLLELALRLAPR